MKTHSPTQLEGHACASSPFARSPTTLSSRRHACELWMLWFTSVPTRTKRAHISPCARPGAATGHMLPLAGAIGDPKTIVGTRVNHDIVTAIDRSRSSTRGNAGLAPKTMINTACKLLLLAACVSMCSGCFLAWSLSAPTISIARRRNRLAALGPPRAKKDGLLSPVIMRRRYGTLVRDTCCSSSPPASGPM